MYQDILPLSLAGDWQREPNALLSENLSQWLFEPDSLTRKLKAHCQTFRVEILSKTEKWLDPQEVELLTHLTTPQWGQVREVLLYCDEIPWVYAQSLMPLSSVPKSAEKLTGLGEKPLGEVIFNEPGMTRSAIEVAGFDENSEVAALSSRLNQPITKTLWGRRSCFHIPHYSLLVSEVFLPQAGAYR